MNYIENCSIILSGMYWTWVQYFNNDFNIFSEWIKSIVCYSERSSIYLYKILVIHIKNLGGKYIDRKKQWVFKKY